MRQALYRYLAISINAFHRCEKAGNQEWIERHEAAIRQLEVFFPSGSGFDHSTNIDLEKSTGDKLVLRTAYRHMTEHGFYDGWTDHTVTVTPSLMFGFRLRVSGRNRNDIKEYISEEFSLVLNRLIEHDAEGIRLVD